MRRPLVPALLSALIVCFVLALTAGATGDDENNLTGAYGNLAGRGDLCAFCHVDSSGGDLNAFGNAYNDAGRNAAALAAIANQDSDGDTFSNDDELKAGTNPGDATDFPSGGGGRVQVNTVAAAGGDVIAIDAAEDTKSKQAIVVHVEDGAGRGAEAAASVMSRIVNSDGEPVKKAATLGAADADSYRDVFAAYGNKRYLVGWTDDGARAVMGRIVKAKVNKTAGGDFEIGDDDEDPVATWTGKAFGVATATTGGVELYAVTTKGKVSRESAWLPLLELTGTIDAPMAFGYPAADNNRVLLAGVGDFGKRKLALAGALLDTGDGGFTQVTTGLSKNSKGKTLRAAAAFGDNAPGLGAWILKTSAYTASLAATGAFSDEIAALREKASKLKVAKKPGAIGVAPQDDDGFLVAWTDSKKKTVMAIDIDAAGKAGDAFQVSTDGDQVITDLLDVTSLDGNVLVTYVTTGNVVKTAVVGPPS